MIFGIPLEIRQHENRVGAVPFLVEELVKRGHQVYVESRAGWKSHFSDEDYEKSGANVVPSAEKLYGQAEIIFKVQSPTPVEYDLIRPEHVIFAFYYFLNNPEVARSLVARGCSCFAYDMYRLTDSGYPFIDNQGQISGQLAVHQGFCLLQTPQGGRGVLPGGIPGVSPAQVVVIGASAAGISAVKAAAQMGANVFVLDPAYPSLQKAVSLQMNNVTPLMLSEYHLRQLLPSTDLLICAMQDVFQSTPVPISKALLQIMREGTVVVDLDIEMGGSIETSHATSFENPILVQEGIVHYCVPNLPGVVPISASPALSNALLPCVLKFVDNGFEAAAKSDPEFATGIAIFEGRIANPVLAEALNVPFYELNGNISSA